MAGVVVGRRTRRIDWREATSGQTTYVDDLHPPDLLVARFLRSPHPHARILELDTSAAERLPGVAAVITAADFGEVRYLHHGPPLADRRPLAKDKVRYLGEEVAAVAAETAEQADAALAAIRVRYAPLPTAATVDEARAVEAPVLHDEHPDNVAQSLRRSWGEPVRVRPAATVSGRYYFNRQTHLCLETNRTTALWHPDAEVLELWTSTQSPYFVRKDVANALALDKFQVKVRDVAVGGGFGSKSKISEHEVLVAALARKAPGRPVRVRYTREEEFACTKTRHDFWTALETDVDADGRLLEQRARIVVDDGAYNHYGPSVMSFGCSILASLYRTPRVDISAELVYTNKQPGGQFRGYGAPQTTYAAECHMDEIAERLGIDPIDLRLRNIHEQGDVTHPGWRIVDTRLAECLERARAETDWDRKRREGGDGRGIGIAISIHPSGSNVYAGSHRSEAWVTLTSEGGITVGFGGADAGTGQRTIIAQVAAEELGVRAEDVDVVMMDSDRTPTDFGAWSSRGTHMAGKSVRAAARAAADGLRDLAAEKLSVAADEVALRDGEATAGSDAVDFGSLVAMAPDALDGQVRFEGVHEDDTELGDPGGRPRNISPTYAFAAHVAEVEVDRATGAVTVLGITAVHDSGTPLNPTDFEGQVYGGVVMGMGAALGEELVYEDGRLANPTLLDYAAPRAGDVPPIRVIAVDHEDPAGPYGAKGIGEIALNPTAAAIANAVAHASGARVRDLPLTPDKVLAAIAQAQGRRPRSYALWRRPDRWWIALLRWLYPRGLHTLLHRVGTRAARRRPRGPVEQVVHPREVGDALAALGAAGAQAIGGGTDLLPAREEGLSAPRVLVDVRAVTGLRDVVETPAGDLRIGGAVPLAALAEHPALAGDEAVRAAVARIASPQIRQVATVAGNLCQEKRCWFYRSGFDCYKRSGPTCPCYAVRGDHRFYHAVLGGHRCQAVTPSDLATVLAALDASVAVEGPRRRRVLGLDELYTGPGETALAGDELLVEVRVPAAARRRRTRFDKLDLWQGDFAIVSAAASLEIADGVVRDARIVLGGVAPTPYRARDSEAALRGRALDDATAWRAAEAWTRHAHPLEHNGWKVDAAVGLLRRTIRAAAA